MQLTIRAFILALLGFIPLVLVPRPGVVLVWAFIWLVCVLIDWLLTPKPKALTLTRNITPHTVRLGEPAVNELVVYNPTQRRMRVDVRDVWAPTTNLDREVGTLTIPPGERRRWRATAHPVRRGWRHNQATALRCYGPLGLASRTHTGTIPGRLLVLPPFRARRHLPSRLARLREMDGASSVNVRGQGTEFDSLREYVIGDDVRAIDWRATARLRDVLVRTWRPERDRRVVIVLDTGRLAAVRLGVETRLDTSIEAALLLAALASHAGDRVDVMACDTTTQAQVSSQSSSTLMHQLAINLAHIEPMLEETDWTYVASQVRRIVRQRSLVVFITALDPAVISGNLTGAVKALARTHTVVVAGAHDAEITALTQQRSTSKEAAIAAAAEAHLADIQAGCSALMRAGAHVVSGLADELPPRLADMYLQLKQAGKL